jgi:hypothetical protein
MRALSAPRAGTQPYLLLAPVAWPLRSPHPPLGHWPATTGILLATLFHLGRSAQHVRS